MAAPKTRGGFGCCPGGQPGARLRRLGPSMAFPPDSEEAAGCPGRPEPLVGPKSNTGAKLAFPRAGKVDSILEWRPCQGRRSLLGRVSMKRSPVTTARCDGNRGCIADVATLARQIPLFPVDRRFDLAELALVRSACRRRIGWAAIFLKAYGMVVRQTPALRSWFLPGLRPRLATTTDNVATLAVNRLEENRERLCWARLDRPEERTVVEIQQFIDDCSRRPLAEMFKRQLELEMLPGWLRRAVLRWNLRSASAKRAARLGTFSVSTLAGFGADNRFHPTLCTSSLCYGPLEPDGRCLVTLIADHRVVDGGLVARSLITLERVLRQDLLQELRQLAAPADHGPSAAAA